jgi:hypothetical protein
MATLGIDGRRRSATSALIVLVLIVSASLGLALGEPLTEEARQVIEEKLLHADIMSNARRALEFCREAEQAAGGYDRDAYYDCAIAKCIGYAEMHLHENFAACIDLARPLEAVQLDHPRYSEVRSWLDSIRND